MPEEQETAELKPTKLTLDVTEAETFLAEINRISAVLAQTSEQLQTIEKNTSVVQKLERISRWDIEELHARVREQLNDMKFESILYLSLQKFLEPAKQRLDSLQNLHFELEEFNAFERRVQRFRKESFVLSVLAGFLLSSAIVGIVGYWFISSRPTLPPHMATKHGKLYIDAKKYTISGDERRFIVEQKGAER